MSAIPHNGWQAGFLQVMPAIETHAKIRFRHLPAERREDLIQESIASACVAYQRLVAQGKLHLACASSLATFAVKQARGGRHVGGHQDAARDAMSPVAKTRHDFKTASYDFFDRDICEWKQMAIADRNASVADVACFRIDFAGWLKTLTRRDRRIIAAFIGGERTMAVADKFGITAGRVSQLRRQYEQQWSAFQRQALAS